MMSRRNVLSRILPNYLALRLHVIVNKPEASSSICGSRILFFRDFRFDLTRQFRLIPGKEPLLWRTPICKDGRPHAGHGPIGSRIAEFYGTCAEYFPASREFWGSLALEEIGHAKIIDNVTTAAVKEPEMFEAGDASPLEALAALDQG